MCFPSFLPRSVFMMRVVREFRFKTIMWNRMTVVLLWISTHARPPMCMQHAGWLIAIIILGSLFLFLITFALCFRWRRRRVHYCEYDVVCDGDQRVVADQGVRVTTTTSTVSPAVYATYQQAPSYQVRRMPRASMLLSLIFLLPLLATIPAAAVPRIACSDRDKGVRHRYVHLSFSSLLPIYLSIYCTRTICIINTTTLLPCPMRARIVITL